MDWKGNVRELENVIENMNVLTADTELLPAHLPSEIFESAKESLAKLGLDYTMPYKTMVNAIHNLEKDYYLYHLQKAKSVRDAAINRMDMPPSTLRDKMDFYEISYRINENENNKLEHTREENEQSV